nr:unnamed protein product [Callosobruchus chinensis]
MGVLLTCQKYVRGAAVEIQKDAKNAVISPCFNHALNLSISKSIGVKSVKNANGTIQEIVTFFRGSAKRDYVLKKHLKRKLSSPCQTRWIERHDSILQFQNDLPLICDALREKAEWNDDASSSKGNILLRAVSNCEFILTVYTLADIFAITLPFSKYLQDININNIETAKSKLKLLLKSLGDKRVNADSYFKSIICKSARETMSLLDADLKIPRIVPKQTQRANFSDTNQLPAEEYWKRVLFIPILDFIINDLKERFSDKLMGVFFLNLFLPNNIKNCSDTELHINLSNILEQFGPLLGNPSIT